MLKPVPVTLMHCSAVVPQRLFMTTYRPPMVVDPYWSQISVSAWAAGATATGAARPAAASSAADKACLSFICLLHVVVAFWERSQCGDSMKPQGNRQGKG